MTIGSWRLPLHVSIHLLCVIGLRSKVLNQRGNMVLKIPCHILSQKYHLSQKLNFNFLFFPLWTIHCLCAKSLFLTYLFVQCIGKQVLNIAEASGCCCSINTVIMNSKEISLWVKWVGKAFVLQVLNSHTLPSRKKEKQAYKFSEFLLLLLWSCNEF